MPRGTRQLRHHFFNPSFTDDPSSALCTIHTPCGGVFYWVPMLIGCFGWCFESDAVANSGAAGRRRGGEQRVPWRARSRLQPILWLVRVRGVLPVAIPTLPAQAERWETGALPTRVRAPARWPEPSRRAAVGQPGLLRHAPWRVAARLQPHEPVLHTGPHALGVPAAGNGGPAG